MKVDIGPEGYVVEAEDLGPLLGVDPKEVPALMRDGGITGLFELGQDEHAGSFRMTFWHKGRHVRLICAKDGTVLARHRGTVRG